jgi:hypothetical protein
MGSYIPKSSLHIDRHLSNVAINYRPRNFFADQIAPIIPVQHQSNLYKVYSQADLWRIEDTTRAPGNEANRYEISVGSDSYVAKNYALKTGVTIEDRSNADPEFVRDLESGRVMTTQDKLMLDYDRRISVQVSTTSNVGTGTNVASSWSDRANSDPYTDISTMMATLEDATGYRPNSILFFGKSWRLFRENNTVIDKIKATALAGADLNVNVEQVKALFDIDRVVLGTGYFNSGEEGQGLTLSQMAQDHVLVYYAPMQASIERPSFMYSFRWQRPGLPNMQVERLPYDPKRKLFELEIGYYQDEKITSAPLGGLISWTTSSQ